MRNQPAPHAAELARIAGILSAIGVPLAPALDGLIAPRTAGLNIPETTPRQ